MASDDDVHTSVLVSEASEPEPEVDWNRFSRFNRSVNSIAYVLRFIKRVRSTSILLSVEEREYAKQTIFKLVQQEAKRAIATGDLVWIIEDSDKRGQYVLGRVVDVRTGSDGVVRSASIQTKDGIYIRPAVKLALVLEQNGVFSQKENRAGEVGAS